MSQTKGTELHEEKERPARIRVETFSHWEFIFCRYGLYQLDRVVEGGRGYCNTYTPCKDKQLELDVLSAVMCCSDDLLEICDVLDITSEKYGWCHTVVPC